MIEVTENTQISQHEFYDLLEESRFVARAIDLHLKNGSQLLESDSHFTGSALEMDDDWKALVTKNLPDWLFWITDILMMQARLVAHDHPLSRSELAALLQHRFLQQASPDLRLNDSQKRVWTTHMLRGAISAPYLRSGTRAQ